MISKMTTAYIVCEAVRSNTNQKVSFQSLLSKIRKEFQKRQIDLYIRSNRKSSLTPEEYYVNAYYDAEDEHDQEVPIEIVIYHNFDKNVLWDRSHVTNLLIQIYDAVVHEFCHQEQSQKRHHKLFWSHSTIELQYLSDPDEIDAYSLSIAIELCRSLGKERALRQLSRFKRLSRFKIRENFVSPNLFAFVKVFEDIDENILRTVVKKIYKRIQKIDTDIIFM